MLTLYRSHIIDQTNRGKVRRLILVTPSARIFAAIENAEDPDMMPVGESHLEMAKMATSGMRALWLPNTELFGHPANFADQLKGCWAAGHATPMGVEASTDAFSAIFKEHGGFHEKKQVPFQVQLLNPNDMENLLPLASGFGLEPYVAHHLDV